MTQKTPEGRGMDILRSIGTRETPQHRRASAGQVPNSFYFSDNNNCRLNIYAGRSYECV